jgi:methylenetetrahydrofolate dehydrogenase (NADP+)/methenyltetrahydrofolate cyclohydrolase/formyltetrahydrofolate synthetase
LITKIGIQFTLKNLPETITQAELVLAIQRLNESSSVHGILVQLPLPSHINEKEVTDVISVKKDVDGFHTTNIGLLAKRDATPLFEACTPKGIMSLLEHENIILSGKRVVVIGRSNIVGMPVAHMLQSKDATVTVCHSKTLNMPEIVQTADVVIIAAGSPELVKGSWLKKDAIVIDVGTNAVKDETKKSGFRWVGDADFESCSRVAQAITPVPGGVGPMTVAMLMKNTVESAKLFLNAPATPVQYLVPELLEPVPRYFCFYSVILI